MPRIAGRTSACLVAGLLAASCAAPPPAPPAAAPRSYLVLLADEDGTTGKVIYTGQAGEIALDRAHQAVALTGPAVAYEIGSAQLDRDTQPALGAQPRLPRTFVLYFEVGDARINKASEALLLQVLDELRARTVPDLSITGHTDTVGQSALNETLSLRRAEQVARLVKASTSSVIPLDITSHGERNLLIATPDNTPEPRNRRVEITVR